jgi:choline-glycine betaine transporter
MSKEFTTTAHDPRDYKFRLSVSIIPLAIFLSILVAGIVMPDTFKRIIDNAVMVVMKDFGWFISLSTLFFLVFCLALLFLPVGKIRLGGPGSKPDLSTFEYFALSLCAGMATGFILWPTAEMIEYTSFPPRVFGVEPGSYQSVVDALKFEWLHWAFTPYALYTAFGVVVSYAFYNLRKSYTVSCQIAMLPYHLSARKKCCNARKKQGGIRGGSALSMKQRAQAGRNSRSWII